MPSDLHSLELASQPAVGSLDDAHHIVYPPHARRSDRYSTLLQRTAKWLFIVMLVRVFIGETSVVPTPSMEGTILVGDHLIVNKLLFGPQIPFTPFHLPRMRHARRGEIIVFRYPRNPSELFLKRVAAVGGDRVAIRNGVLMVNDQPVMEPYAIHRRPHPADENMPELVVSPGSLFMMGDNRDHSNDSRDWGTVPEENVVGAPVLIYWSYAAPTSQWLEKDPVRKLRFYASIPVHFFKETRWSRTGTLL